MKRPAAITLIVSGVFVLTGIAFFALGANKLHVYFNPSQTYLSSAAKNVYVGGDAYNYIINSSRATGYFVIGSSCIICAFLTLILNCLMDIRANTAVSSLSMGERTISQTEHTTPSRDEDSRDRYEDDLSPERETLSAQSNLPESDTRQA